ncbi:hypothetical protein ACFWA6_15155 [Streptomyces sp. NPDC060020]|uniref:hypothetical protein n=1 Tax=Streptomyces sp. NPDC060020 TaxID=3347038 RepID=UPI0036BA9E86
MLRSCRIALTIASTLLATAPTRLPSASRPVGSRACGHLAALGPAARPAARTLRDVPARDRRLRSHGGWRSFLQDEDVRTAVAELLSR